MLCIWGSPSTFLVPTLSVSGATSPREPNVPSDSQSLQTSAVPRPAQSSSVPSFWPSSLMPDFMMHSCKRTQRQMYTMGLYSLDPAYQTDSVPAIWSGPSPFCTPGSSSQTKESLYLLEHSCCCLMVAPHFVLTLPEAPLQGLSLFIFHIYVFMCMCVC